MNNLNGLEKALSIKYSNLQSQNWSQSFKEFQKNHQFQSKSVLSKDDNIQINQYLGMSHDLT